jgi:hypothetical protein
MAKADVPESGLTSVNPTTAQALDDETEQCIGSRIRKEDPIELDTEVKIETGMKVCATYKVAKLVAELRSPRVSPQA